MDGRKERLIQFFGPNNATDLWHVKKVNPQVDDPSDRKAGRVGELVPSSTPAEPGRTFWIYSAVSGSTLIAAEQTGRKAYLMEIDALYCDIIVSR